jgi:hypothetical protein
MPTQQITDGSADGAQFPNTKLGFYGAPPVAQVAAITPPTTSAATSTTPFGFATSTQANAVIAWIAAVNAALSKSAGGVGLIP